MDALGSRRIEGDGTTEASWAGCATLAGLPRTTRELLVPRGRRAVVVAPHPDDEVLSVGGLLVQLARAGVRVDVITVTDGTASHPGSTCWPVERLRHERAAESRAALRCLGVDRDPIRLGLPDGGLAPLQGLLAERLQGLIHRCDVVFTTWRRDGHPDHEATGHACAFVAARNGARLIEVPVWAWHWAGPGDRRLPWRHARQLRLDAEAVRRKRSAVDLFESQLQPDASTGAGPILRPTTVERAARPYEVVFS